MSVENVSDFCVKNVSFMISNDKIDILVKRCKELINSNKPELAYILANEALVAFPDSYEALCQRALSLMALKQMCGALRDFEAVSQLNPNWNFIIENLRKRSSISSDWSLSPNFISQAINMSREELQFRCLEIFGNMKLLMEADDSQPLIINPLKGVYEKMVACHRMIDHLEFRQLQVDHEIMHVFRAADRRCFTGVVSLVDVDFSASEDYFTELFNGILEPCQLSLRNLSGVSAKTFNHELKRSSAFRNMNYLSIYANEESGFKVDAAALGESIHGAPTFKSIFLDRNVNVNLPLLIKICREKFFLDKSVAFYELVIVRKEEVAKPQFFNMVNTQRQDFFNITAWPLPDQSYVVYIERGCKN